MIKLSNNKCLVSDIINLNLIRVSYFYIVTLYIKIFKNQYNER